MADAGVGTPTLDSDALVDIPAARTAYPEIPASTIRRWAHEGRLPRHGSDHRGRTLYRIGDLADLAATHRTRTLLDLR